MAGSLLAILLLAVGAWFTDTPVWLAQRRLVGAGGALVFVTGGLYCGGTGVGITLSALVIPAVLQWAALRPHTWASGIGAFTIVHAAGQIIGPTMVGWVSDGSGACSAASCCPLSHWGPAPL